MEFDFNEVEIRSQINDDKLCFIFSKFKIIFGCLRSKLHIIFIKLMSNYIPAKPPKVCLKPKLDTNLKNFKQISNDP